MCVQGAVIAKECFHYYCVMKSFESRLFIFLFAFPLAKSLPGTGRAKRDYRGWK